MNHMMSTPISAICCWYFTRCQTTDILRIELSEKSSFISPFSLCYLSSMQLNISFRQLSMLVKCVRIRYPCESCY